MTRRLRPLIVGTAVAVAVAGCANPPDSGPITHVEAIPTQEEDPLYYDPAGPVEGAPPVEIVRGFYEAMRAYPIRSEDAEEFLTAQARRNWEPAERTIIYEADVEPRRAGPNVVEARVGAEAVLDRRGSYRPAPPTGVLDTSRLFLRREQGEWRIANPPDTLYVDSYFFSRFYEPFSLYFISSSGDAVVPEPIYLPIGEQPATALVREVLAGPSPSWRGQLVTAVPPLTELDVSVPITPADVAEVRLAGPILDLSPDQQRLLSAQLVWTLAQLPGLDGVRILVDGVPLKVPGRPAVQDIDQWSEFDPLGLPTRGQLYALESGRLVGVLGRRGVKELTGTMWGARQQGIRSFDVDLQLSRVVAVSTDGQRLLSGPLYASAGQVPRTVYANGVDLGTPVDAPGGEWLVVDRLPGGSSRLLVSDGEGVRFVSMGGLQRQRIESLSLSPDGMRFAALARPATPRGPGAAQIVTGRVQWAPGGERVAGLFDVRELVVVGDPMSDVRSVEWSDADRLAVLARGDDATTLEPYTVRIDGSDLTNEWFIPDTIKPARLLTSVGADGKVYVATQFGRLWVESNGLWFQVEAPGLTALNFAG
jgi:hypothetical protein